MPTRTPIRRIAFLLVDGFGLMSTASAMEPLRAANLFSAEPLYEVTVLSLGKETARASAGSTFAARPFFRAGVDFDLIFVVAGGDPTLINDPTLFAWLRRADRAGVALGGISGGSVILARAGLLEGFRYTVHWHHFDDMPALTETAILEQRLFVIDRRRYTCAGGSSPLDMMHTIISRDHGSVFATRISDWFLQTEVRPPEAEQQSATPARFGPLPAPVQAAIDLMESHIADPLSLDQIATLSGLGARQLQRRVQAATGLTVMDLYRQLRLDTARALLVETALPVGEVAAMTGFATPAHFAAAYRRHFGSAPREGRRPRGA